MRTLLIRETEINEAGQTETEKKIFHVKEDHRFLYL